MVPVERFNAKQLHQAQIGNAMELQNKGWHGISQEFTERYGSVFKVRRSCCPQQCSAAHCRAAGLAADRADHMGGRQSLPTYP